MRPKSPRSPRLHADCSLSHSFSSCSSTSPASSGANSPAASFSNRPLSLHGLSQSLTCVKSPNRRKSVHNIPLSPLARTPSPSPIAISPTTAHKPSKLACSGGRQLSPARAHSRQSHKHRVRATHDSNNSTSDSGNRGCDTPPPEVKISDASDSLADDQSVSES